MTMTRDDIWDQLLIAEQKARSSKLHRLGSSPLMYPALMGFNYVLYPLLKKGVFVRANTFFGIPFRTLLPSGTDLMLNGIKSHDSEIRLSKFFCRHLQSGDLLIDVGAHYGYYSLLASVLVGDHGHVHSIEASSNSFEILKRNIECRNNISARHAAAGEKHGKIVFYEYPGPYAEYNTTVENAYEKAKWLKNIQQKITTVPVIMVDQLIDENQIKKATLKIDVEGGEAAVIRGLQKSFPVTELTIAMEYLLREGDNQQHKEAVQLLEQNGFTAHAIDMNGDLQKLSDIDEYLKNKNLTSDNIVFKK